MENILPAEIKELVKPRSLIPNNIGESKSDVFKVDLIDENCGYLKICESSYVLSEIKQEISILNWLEHKLEVPKSIRLVEAKGITYFLMTAVDGTSLAERSSAYSALECMKLGARFLKKIHSISTEKCPFRRDLKITLNLAKNNLNRRLVDESDFDESRRGMAAHEVYEDLIKNIPKEKEDLVFTHGDYCFPNIIVNNGGVSGVVDLGRAGVADRHQDIALFLRSFESNMKQKPDVDLFLVEYGLIKNLSLQKLEFYKNLDEFF
jgi:aminoglycoside phosphotransferase